jgi:hypothetical protein
MKIWYLTGETLFLEFKLINGSGWLTSHRIILVEHEPGRLKDGSFKRQDYLLKDFQAAYIEEGILFALFKSNRMVAIMLHIDTPSLLQEIKTYIEAASKNWQQSGL